MSARRLRPRRRDVGDRGDVHVGSMGGDVRPAPGSCSRPGQHRIARAMDAVLDRVRRDRWRPAHRSGP